MSEPRIEAERPADPRQGTIHPPIPHELLCANPEGWRGLPWATISMVAAGFLLLVIGMARAAELPGRYEITLFHAGKNYDHVERTHFVLSGPYESREACKVAIVRVRVMVSGARLQCTPIEMGRVK